MILQKFILAIFIGRKNWFDSRYFSVGHEFVWNKKKINSYCMFGGLSAPPSSRRGRSLQQFMCEFSLFVRLLHIDQSFFFSFFPWAKWRSRNKLAWFYVLFFGIYRKFIQKSKKRNQIGKTMKKKGQKFFFSLQIKRQNKKRKISGA